MLVPPAEVLVPTVPFTVSVVGPSAFSDGSCWYSTYIWMGFYELLMAPASVNSCWCLLVAAGNFLMYWQWFLPLVVVL